VAFDLITGVNQVETPQSLTSFETSSAYSPHLLMSQSNMQRPRTMSSNRMGLQQPSKRTGSFSRSSSHGLPLPPSNYEDSRSGFAQSDRPLLFGTTAMSNARDISRAYPPLNPTQPQLDPQLQNLSTVSEADTDPLANEFAALDAMEW
jgi:hypothetical protein